MKRSLVLLLFSLIYSVNISAHGQCLNKNVCANGWRYRAEAKAWYTVLPQTTRHEGCSANMTYIATASKSGAYHKSTNAGGSWKFSGWVSQTIRKWGSDMTDLYLATLPNNFYGHPDTIQERYEITTGGQVTGPNSIEVLRIAGFLEATCNTVSSFGLKVWLPSSAQDTIVSESEIIYNGKISLRLGDIHLEGDFANNFPEDFYQVILKEEKSIVKFTGRNLILNIVLPPGRNIDECVLIGETDGMHNDGGEIEKIINYTESQIQSNFLTFSVIHDKAFNKIRVKYAVKEDGPIYIEIYNEDGKMIDEGYLPFIRRNKIVNMSFDNISKKFSKGAHFLLLENGREKLVLKFLIQ